MELMSSLRDIVESSPQPVTLQAEEEPQPLAPARWDWDAVQRVLVVRLRSIGDTVLATPSLFALKRFLPHAQIDILVEDWVAPLLANHPHVDNVIELKRGGVTKRMNVAREIRADIKLGKRDRQADALQGQFIVGAKLYRFLWPSAVGAAT